MSFEPKSAAQAHTLEDGDTLKSIVKKMNDKGHDLTLQEIAKCNWGIED